MVANVEIHPYANVLGPALSAEDLFAIGRRAVAALQRHEVGGVVVTSGTGIIEEGCYASDLVNTSRKPIVWTGAMFSSDMWDTDGPRNLLNAVRVAASEETRGLGAVVCFNQEIHAARDVVKMHKTSLATFASLDLGLLGRADEDRVVVYRQPSLRRSFAAGRVETNVDLIQLAVGSDDRFFRASLAAGARGIVVEGFPGPGIVCPGALPGVLAARRAAVPVVLATRALSGRTSPKYGGEIGAGDLIKHGVILAGDLAPAKARLLLMVLLGLTDDNSELTGLFADAAP